MCGVALKKKALHPDQVISELTKTVDFLAKKVDSLTGRLTELETENSDLKAEVAKLKAQLNSNSRNSSKPPSSDGYKKKPAFPRKKKGKQGGQQGHKGRTLQQVEHPDKTVKHKPGPCDCGHVFSDEEWVWQRPARFLIYHNPNWRLSHISC